MQSGLPVTLTSPLHVMSDLIDQIVACQACTLNEDVDMDNGIQDEPSTPKHEPDLKEDGLLTPAKAAIAELATTSLSHLVSYSTPHSLSKIPLFPPNTISPFQSYNQELLELETKTVNEKCLQDALREVENCDRK